MKWVYVLLHVCVEFMNFIASFTSWWLFVVGHLEIRQLWPPGSCGLPEKLSTFANETPFAAYVTRQHEHNPCMQSRMLGAGSRKRKMMTLVSSKS